MNASTIQAVTAELETRGITDTFDGPSLRVEFDLEVTDAIGTMYALTDGTVFIRYTAGGEVVFAQMVPAVASIADIMAVWDAGFEASL